MPFDPDDPRLTAFALGELDADDRAAIEAILRDDPDGRAFVLGVEQTAALLTEELRLESADTAGLDPSRRTAIEGRLDPPAPLALPSARPRRRLLIPVAAAAGLLGVGATIYLASTSGRLPSPRYGEIGVDYARVEAPTARAVAAPGPTAPDLVANNTPPYEVARSRDNSLTRPQATPAPGSALPGGETSNARGLAAAGRQPSGPAAPTPASSRGRSLGRPAEPEAGQPIARREVRGRISVDPFDSPERLEITGGMSTVKRKSTFALPNPNASLFPKDKLPATVGGQPGAVGGRMGGIGGGMGGKGGGRGQQPSDLAAAKPPGKPSQQAQARAGLAAPGQAPGEGAIERFANPDGDPGLTPAPAEEAAKRTGDAPDADVLNKKAELEQLRRQVDESRRALDREQTRVGRESYARTYDNPFRNVVGNELSTFAVDVDTASYANVRRFLDQGQLPPVDAVRIEELVNYFAYDDPAPRGDDPFSVNLEVAACPWDASHRLARIGLKGRTIDADKRPSSNLVFLIDVSGSMADLDKLPLLKAGMKLLVDRLGENDRVGIVVYANNSRVVLPSTPCHDRRPIQAAIDALQAGGGTNGGAGIQLAYEMAQRNFIRGGTNRVLLATDGDFNVGVSQADLLATGAERARSNIFLSVLGFGQGNIQEGFMEQLADKGNGHFAYIDSIDEARKVLVRELSGTLVTIAKDVKVQVEFNPARVASYRLIGYENRVMPNQDFRDDAKDAGEIGAGHSVTALYEIVPAAIANLAAADRPLKYGNRAVVQNAQGLGVDASPETMTVYLRHKQPEGDKATEISKAVVDDGRDFGRASADLKFAAAVAGFGMLLRESPHRGSLSLPAVLEIASSALGDDRSGDRKGFLDLVRKAEPLRASSPVSP